MTGRGGLPDGRLVALQRGRASLAWRGHRVPGGGWHTERATDGNRFGFLARRLCSKTRARRDERDTQATEICLQEPNPPIFGRSLHQVLVRESGRTVARVRTRQVSSAGSSSASGETAWLFGMDTGPCVAKARLWHLYELGQRSGCELCVLRPVLPRGGRDRCDQTEPNS